MLKIKDDVDLKELEKFGFKYNKDNYTYINYYEYQDKYGFINIFNLDRGISVDFSSCLTTKSGDILYDLIQARIGGKSK